MKLLWITNTIFPALSKSLGLPASFSGGWMYGLGGQIAATPGIKLAVATVYQGRELKVLDLDNVRYYILPCYEVSGYQKQLEQMWKEVCAEFAPDVVHIHGTEYQHGLACMRACEALRYVVSIQGLVSVINEYYYAGLTYGEIFKNITIRDFLRWNTVFHGKRTFAKRGVYEEEYIKRTQHVIGRTRWDYAHVKKINSAVNYHFCNESLRDGFYSASKWDYSKKNDFSIFLSQASYPIKGLHQVLKAVALLVGTFPRLRVRIAGHSIINQSTFVDRLKINGYGSYIIKLIKLLGLESQVEFTGPLTEEKMIEEYKKSHLFICPSSIENSPNSIGEAQLLGVPTIASFVGGVPDMISHGETGLLYRFEDVEILAENIRQVFVDNELAQRLSKQGILAALQRHNQTVNRDRTVDIYKCLVS